ncbi:MAG: hypothetical protein MR821_08330, partial [Clostridiales bacterium]|nr:hypothetical protein [Clostridiales bacterium]
LKELGILAVVPGDGLTEIFKGIGADTTISGGQTMNPSTEDILNAVEKIPAKTVFVLPNNSNIILAATQADVLCDEKEIIVIPTKTIPQGISALVSFDHTGDAESNKENMMEAIESVLSGQVTYAVRDTQIDGHDVKKGDYIAINDEGLVASETDIKDSILKMLDGMVSDEHELISIYFGSDVDEADAEDVAEVVKPREGDLRAAAPVHERQRDGEDHRDEGEDDEADEVRREEGISDERVALFQPAHLMLSGCGALCHVA